MGKKEKRRKSRERQKAIQEARRQPREAITIPQPEPYYETRIGLFGLPWRFWKKGGLLIKSKFRWIIRLFKDGKQIQPEEIVKVNRRPPLTITAYAEEGIDKVHTENIGGEFEITFFRKDIEDFDEIWLGLYWPEIQPPAIEPELLEEFELVRARSIPQLFTNHCVEQPEEEEPETTLTVAYEHMRWRNPWDKTWKNGSVVHD